MIFEKLIEVISKEDNRYLVLASLLTIIIGAVITVLDPSIARDIIKQVEEIHNTIKNFSYVEILALILRNNLTIMAACYVGGLSVIVTPALGLWAVGRPVGVVFLQGFLEGIFILAIYGALELSGFTLAITSGYRLTKYLISKVFRRKGDSASRVLYESGIIVLYALMFIIVAALAESYILYTLLPFEGMKATIQTLPILLALFLTIGVTAFLIITLILTIRK